jgi:N6-L-threonylcarbamoyladenine synthase
MKILGIETSCDDTSCAIVDDNKTIINNLILSQTSLHKEFGGVVPELAARSHAETLDKLIQKSLSDSHLNFNDLDAIAVTAGPGLIGGLIVGLMTAKAICSVYKKPFIAVNHLEAHSLTIRLTNDVPFPYLLLLVSGGHCQILLVQTLGKYKKFGETIDDALGETFDKVARMLGLEYPGGPKIEELAKSGNENRFDFPKPLLTTHKFNFSFSGLKTAVRREIEKLTGENYQHLSSGLKLSTEDQADIAASFQKTIASIIINRLQNVIDENHLEVNNLVIAGGVAANQYLYRKIAEFIKRKYSLNTISPPVKLCTDNAAMVAWVGIEKFKSGKFDNLNFKPLAKWELD